MQGSSKPQRGHRASASLGQSISGQKAFLNSAYNELGKALFASEIKVVGNYSLGRVIGEGSYGQVRLALNRLTSTRCAIKQIPRSGAPPMLTREIHHHRKLRHPHVVQLYEIIATESHIWLAAELCAGGELFDYLVEQGRLQESEARRVFGQLCIGLAYIHSQGVVHRDLKLENVLLDERCNVKIADFGFGREFERGRVMDTFCGTTGYASPEMLAGRKYLGEEVDIWALGVILYTLLTGSLPFDDDDEIVMKDKIMAIDYEMPRWLPEDVKDLISRILVLEPKQRLPIKDIVSHAWFRKPLMPNTPYDAFAMTSPDPIPEEEGSVFTAHQRDASARTVDSNMSTLSDQVFHPATSSSASMSFKSPTDLPASIPRPTASDSTFRAADSPAMRRIASDSRAPGSDEDASTMPFGRPRPISVVSMSRSSSVNSPLPVAHSRTPSRTKRRSVGSTLSERLLPATLPPIIDYVSLLEEPDTPVMSTPLEKNLLESLAAVGFDTGQMIHSVKVDACDCASAVWWQVKRKAEERAESLLERDSIQQSPAETARRVKQSSESASTPGRPASGEGDLQTPSREPKKPSSSPGSPKRSRPRASSASGQRMPGLNSSTSDPMLSRSGSKSAEKLSYFAMPPRNRSQELLSSSGSATPPVETSPSLQDKKREKQRSASISILQRATSAFGKSDTPKVEGEPVGRSTPLGALFGRKPSVSAASSPEKAPRELKLKEPSEPPGLAISLPKAKPAEEGEERPKTANSVGSPSVDSEGSPALGSDFSHESHVTAETSNTQSSSSAKLPDLSSPSSTASGAGTAKQRTGSSLFSSFRLWFNEDRKKRKRSSTLAGFEGSSITQMRPTISAGSVRRTAAREPGSPHPPRTAGSRRSSSGTSHLANSRRSSMTSSIHITPLDRQHTSSLHRQPSGGSHSFTSPVISGDTPTSDKGSRPSSFVSTEVPQGGESMGRGDSRRQARHSRTGSTSSLGSRKSGTGGESPHSAFRRPATTTQVRRVARPVHHRRDSTSSSIRSASSRRSSLSEDELKIPTDHSVIQEEAEPQDDVVQERERALRKLSGEYSRTPRASVMFTAHKSASTFASPALTGTTTSHSRTSSSATLRPKLRDVFAQPKKSLSSMSESDWIDEDDLGGFAGGFGQSTSSTSSFSTSPVSAAPELFGSSILGTGRYAGVGEANVGDAGKRTAGKGVGLGFRTAAVVIEEDEEEE